MVFTATQTNAFLEGSDHIVFLNRTQLFFEDEGIVAVAGIHKWEDDEWYQFVFNCRRPSQVKYPNNAGTWINQAIFALPMKSLKHLKETARLNFSSGQYPVMSLLETSSGIPLV